MKNFFTLCFCFAVALSLTGQDTFSDDFEAFSVGDFVSSGASNWTTWSGNVANAEDARVTDDMAASGSNSIAFVGAAGGGPQDVVLDFGGVRNSGQFDFSANFFMEEGNGAYFNFQGAANVGQIWSMNCFMNADGTFLIDDTAVLHVSTTYPQGQWFNIAIEANLTENFWRVLIDGQCVGSFANQGTNAIASLDLFPLDADNVFYVDDVSYDYSATAGPAPENDAQIILDNNGTVGFAGSVRDINGFIVNAGTTIITSAEISYTIDGTGYTQTLNGLGLAPGANRPFTLDNQVTLGDNPIIVDATLSEVNGDGFDDNMCNDSFGLSYNGFTPHPDRKVFAEEGTGTWCPWCPRGDVFMNLMEERYGDLFVGVAVHNQDPMVVPTWDSGMPTFPGFQGYPSVIFDRQVVIDPSQLENSVVANLQTAPDAVMIHEATFDENTRELNFTVHTQFAAQSIGDYNLIVGLTEDGVTGTTAAYNQFNNYANGAAGPMGGYEFLPNPVPASQMVYNHTSRALLTPFNGMEDAFSNTIIVEAGWYEHEFSYTVPADFAIENMHIVSAITETGSVDNAQTSTINSAVDTKDIGLENSITVSPNPASFEANVRIDLSETANVSMIVTDAMGKLIAKRNYGSVSGDNVFPINTSNYPAGIYYIKVNADESFAMKKLIISK
jgi:hypothetical protein